MSAHVIYESRLELARLLVADFDQSVNCIVAPPFMLRAPFCGSFVIKSTMSEVGSDVAEAAPHIYNDTWRVDSFHQGSNGVAFDR